MVELSISADRPVNESTTVRQPHRPIEIFDGTPGTLPEFWPMIAFPEGATFERGEDQVILSALTRALDKAVDHFENGQWLEGLQYQEQAMTSARKNLTKSAWTAFAKTDCHSHPLRQFLLQDPFTRRSFQRPRKYPGDAVLIDYMYGISHPEHELQDATPLGRWTYAYTTNTKSLKG
jgi:hypothetical protein